MESQSRVVAESFEPWLSGLDNKVVMVTGASSGLGREFCLDLAKAGCKVIAAARRIDRLQTLCSQINNGYIQEGTGSNEPRAVSVELDISASEPDVEAGVKRAWDAFGRIDALINNAGVRGRVHTPLDLSEDEWNDAVRTNLTGTWLVTKHACARMVDAKKGGTVITISSIGGIERGLVPGGLSYTCTKAALTSMTKVMALELGAHGIRVNSIAPGLFESEITKELMKKDWLKTVMKKTSPLRTYGTIDPALTCLVRYLIHDSSKYVTGNTFIADAGVTLPGVPIFSSL